MEQNQTAAARVIELLNIVRGAMPSLRGASTAVKNEALRRMAALLGERTEAILSANAADVASAQEAGLPGVMVKRLTLDETKIRKIAASVLEVADLADPVGEGDCWTRPNGLRIRRVHVPLGLVAIIYEARPNVTVDAAALCIKSGNGALLRGGKEALRTNLVLASVISDALTAAGLDGNAVRVVDMTGRDGADALMKARGLVDVLIPRGSARLIRSVTENASVPVIETGAGNCHGYVAASADPEMALALCVNAKTSNPAVCNAMETLLVHEAAAGGFLPRLKEAMDAHGVELRCDERAAAILGGGVAAASEEDWSTEYDDLILAVKVVSSTEEAIAHIETYSTGHSEMIVTNDLAEAETFRRGVTSAAVYVNASTRFTDGGEFGFGAEIGISTQKLHARGPMGLRELTTVQYYVDGSGQIR